MNVVVNVCAHVIVDDMRDLGDIQATCSDIRGHEDRTRTVLERTERHLALPLRHVAVDGRGLAVQLLAQLVLEDIGLFFFTLKKKKLINI